MSQNVDAYLGCGGCMGNYFLMWTSKSEQYNKCVRSPQMQRFANLIKPTSHRQPKCLYKNKSAKFKKQKTHLDISQ
jgi:predicted metal-binding protein